MIQGKWGYYDLEEKPKQQIAQQPAIPKSLGPSFSTTAGNSYYRNNRIPSTSFVGDKVVQSNIGAQSKSLGPLSQFSNGMDATPENAQRAIELGLTGAVAANETINPERPVYGKTPGSAIIKDAVTGKVLAQGVGPATGGFARNEESRLKDVAAGEARANDFWNGIARQKYLETIERQNSMMAQLDSAIKSGNQEQAVMLTNALKGVGAIQPMNYGANENQLAEARTRQTALPYIGPKAKAETSLQNAQAGYYSDRNTVELGSARAKALADVLANKQKQSGKGALDPKNRIDLENMAMTNPEGYARLIKEFGIAG